MIKNQIKFKTSQSVINAVEAVTRRSSFQSFAVHFLLFVTNTFIMFYYFCCNFAVFIYSDFNESPFSLNTLSIENFS